MQSPHLSSMLQLGVGFSSINYWITNTTLSV